jgi:hypothetical protein
MHVSESGDEVRSLRREIAHERAIREGVLNARMQTCDARAQLPLDSSIGHGESLRFRV